MRAGRDCGRLDRSGAGSGQRARPPGFSPWPAGHPHPRNGCSSVAPRGRRWCWPISSSPRAGASCCSPALSSLPDFQPHVHCPEARPPAQTRASDPLRPEPGVLRGAGPGRRGRPAVRGLQKQGGWSSGARRHVSRAQGPAPPWRARGHPGGGGGGFEQMACP